VNGRLTGRCCQRRHEGHCRRRRLYLAEQNPTERYILACIRPPVTRFVPDPDKSRRL
jgi:hypothetical protein